MKQTFIIDISNINETWKNFEKRTKYTINKCPMKVFKTKDIKMFDEMHKQTRPDRWITSIQIFNLYDELYKKCHLYMTTNAMALISWDDNTAYYLMAARNKDVTPDGSPSRILWEAMKEMNKMGKTKFDLCGANKESITFFKKGFGGELVPQIKDYINIKKTLL
ncbi:MAG: hypothetical protein ACTSUF_11250 [Candidatus Heimdallarchaeaceae archaeon]